MAAIAALLDTVSLVVPVPADAPAGWNAARPRAGNSALYDSLTDITA
jgi:hypothetical protein